MKKKPALLTSYAFLKSFLKKRDLIQMRSWALDSGAFTAFNTGKPVDLSQYIEAAKELKNKDPLLEDIFALDVIGDFKASMINVEKMERKGLAVIPTFHYGGDFNNLKSVSKNYPKIALGGMAAKLKDNHGQKLCTREKFNWLKKCFDIIWPKRVHLFGCTQEKILMSFPAESADSTSWHLQPSRYGNWKHFGPLKNVRGVSIKVGMQGQIAYCMKIEEDVQKKWAVLFLKNNIRPFSYRLAMTGSEAHYFF